METTFYTLTANHIVVERDQVARVSGGGEEREVLCLKRAAAREQPMGKVISLADYRRAEEPEEDPDEEPEDSGLESSGRVSDRSSAPRPRRKHDVALALDFCATGAIVVAMAFILAKFFLL